MSELDEAIARVLTLPSFAAFTREDLLHTPTFSAALRQSVRDDLIAAADDLEVIADENDDWAEASGFLIYALNMGPLAPLPEVSDADLDITDADSFADAVIHMAPSDRADAADALMPRQIDHVWRIAPDDTHALAQYAYVRQIVFYGMDRVAELLETSDPWETFCPDLNLADQVHPRLLEVFRSRPETEQRALIDARWGADAWGVSDLMVLLEWAAAGEVQIHRSADYLEAVTELVVEVSRRHRDGITYLADRPFLALDFTEALAAPGCFAWLARLDPTEFAVHLAALAEVGFLEIALLVAIIDEGLAKGWGGPKEGRAAILELRAALTGES